MDYKQKEEKSLQNKNSETTETKHNMDKLQQCQVSFLNHNRPLTDTQMSCDTRCTHQQLQQPKIILLGLRWLLKKFIWLLHDWQQLPWLRFRTVKGEEG